MLVGGFELLMCVIIANVGVNNALDQILVFAPPMVRALVEQGIGGTSPAALIAFGWNHPIPHAVGAAVAITLATRSVAAEIENGAIELVLAQPISRGRYLAAHVLFAGLVVTLLAAVGFLGTTLGERVMHLTGIATNRALLIALNYVLLQSAVFGIALVFSAFGREAGRVALAAFVVTLVSYLINAVATLWSAAAFLDRYSLHSYFRPRVIVTTGSFGWDAVVVLGGIAVLGIGAASWRFVTRDLP